MWTNIPLYWLSRIVFLEKNCQSGRDSCLKNGKVGCSVRTVVKFCTKLFLCLEVRKFCYVNFRLERHGKVCYSSLWVWPYETFYITLTCVRELRMKIKCWLCEHLKFSLVCLTKTLPKILQRNDANRLKKKTGVAECARNWNCMLRLLLHYETNQADIDLLIMLCPGNQGGSMKCINSSWFVWRIGKLVLVKLVEPWNLFRTSVLVRLN
jgi:hypothetical protein